MILPQHLKRILGDLNAWPSVLAAELAQKFAHQQRNILLAFAQGRHKKRHHVEPVKEVFAEVALGNLLFEILVGRGDQSHIDAQRLRAADRREQLLVERRQHLGLRLQAHVADLVEKQRAAVGALQHAGLLGRPSGARTVAIAEQLRLDVILGNCRAVHLNEDAVAAQAFGVNGARDQSLARARFAVDQHAAIGRCHQLDLLAQRLERHAFAGEHGADVELPLELDVLGAQPLRLDRIFEHDQRAVERERFLKKVVGAEFGGLDGGLDGAVATDDDHLGPRLGRELMNVGEHVEPVAIGQPDVEQNHVVGCVLEQRQSLGRVGRRGHAVALFAQNLFERVADLFFVVDDQNVIHA